MPVKWWPCAQLSPGGAAVNYLGKAESPFVHVRDHEYQRIKLSEEELARAAALGLQMENFIMPRTGPVAEKQSFEAYHKKCFTEHKLPFSYTDIRPKMRELYRPVVGCVSDPMPNLKNEAFWVHKLTLINGKSSPGMPYAFLAKDNADLIRNPFTASQLVWDAISVIEVLSQMDPDELEAVLRNDPTFGVKAGLADIVRIFIKNQACLITKLESEKWRNIKSVSLRDFLVDVFTFGPQDDVEIANWRDIPSKPGMGLTDSNGVSLLRYAEEHNLATCTDMSVWEASVLYQLLKMEAERRIDFCRNPSAAYKNLVRNRLRIDAFAVVMASDGVLMQRLVPGQTLSGKKYTASMNSAARVMLSLVVAKEASRRAADPLVYERACCMAMGDDSVETSEAWEVRKQVYAECGFTLTDENVGTGISFCSHHIFKDVVGSIRLVPQAPEKLLAHVASQRGDQQEAVLSAFENLRHHPRALELCGLIQDVATARATKTNEN